MNSHRIKFTQNIGALAQIDGVASLGETAVLLELSMTESITGDAKGVIKRYLPYEKLQDVKFQRSLLLTPILRFVTDDLEVLRSVPGASSFEYAVNPACSRMDRVAFIAEARLLIAEAATGRLRRRFEQVGS